MCQPGWGGDTCRYVGYYGSLNTTSAIVRSCAEISVRNTAAVTTAPASASRVGTDASVAWTGAAGTAGATGRVSGPWATTGTPSGGK